MHKHLRRLERVWINDPIYFVTTCTYRRDPILADGPVASILIDEWQCARERYNWAVGSYVIMPDHVHFFCTAEHDAKTLSHFVGSWKRWTSRRIHAVDRPRTASTATARPLWQREFFDHVLRSSESYSEKWNYVRENPVRAGIVACADAWPYSGTIEELRLAE